MDGDVMLRVGSFLVERSRNNYVKAAREIDSRKAFFERILVDASGSGVRVLVLPAGFFCVASVDQVEPLARALETFSARHDTIVGFGIDVRSDDGDCTKGGGKAEGLRNASCNFFGLVLERGVRLVGLVEQTGIHTDEVDTPTVADNIEARLAQSNVIPGLSLALLMCGEVQSSAWRSELHRRSPGFILHPAHASVQLAGSAHESWAPKIGALLAKPLTDTVWVFADHVAAGQHLDSQWQLAPLVRQVGAATSEAPSPWLQIRGEGESGWLYLYDVKLPMAASVHRVGD